VELSIFKTPKMLRAFIVAKLFGAKFKIRDDLKTRGAYSKGIIYLRRDAEAITVLHEIGHHLAGRGCCREHEEFMAHGVCIALANFLGIYYGDIDRNMTSYATLEDCSRIKDKKAWAKTSQSIIKE
tara:strand:- start:600 stop:977 length:378 start_codon:yes stop_codon:yes gene_type:complete